MTVFSMFAPHRRAAELIDQKLDAERGEGELLRADSDWLDRHVSRCAKCSVVLDDRMKQMKALRALGTAKAPEGFAGRVLLAAKTRKHEVAEEKESAWGRPMVPFAQFAIGAALFLVIFVSAGVALKIGDSGKPHEKGATGLAGGGLAIDEDAPHFVVRAPSVGAAKARSDIIKVVESHGGTFNEQGSAIIARIPRSGLVAVTHALAARAAFRMTKADAGELPADLQTIVIRFELD